MSDSADDSRDRMQQGDVDQCGRCGRHRSAGPFKDVTVHTASAEVGQWFLCDGCIAKLDTMLMEFRRSGDEE